MTISAIIPFLDEEKTIKNVVEKLLKHPKISEIICINDGSSDKTSDILLPFRNEITIIHLKKNHGKGYALATGVERAKGDVIAFFDADLIGFSKRHIDTLLNPILKHNAQVVLGYPMPNTYHFVAYLSQNNTGERAYYKKDLLPLLTNMKQSRFGIEVLLNHTLKEKNIHKVPLKNLTHLFKHQKYSTGKALQQYIKMGIEIADEIGRQEGLLPKDYQTLQTMKNVTNISEVKSTINAIQPKRLRKILRQAFSELFF